MIVTMTHAQKMATWQALSQYVENAECNDAVEDPEKDIHLPAAREVLVMLDEYVSKL